MRYLVTLLVLLALLLPSSGTADELRPAAHITSQTTTVMVAAVTGKQVQLMAGSICLDGNGATTGVAIQDTGGTNIIGTSVVYVLAAGECLYFPRSNAPYGQVTASGTGLQIVTTVGNGPINAYFEAIQQ